MRKQRAHWRLLPYGHRIEHNESKASFPQDKVDKGISMASETREGF